MKTVLRAIISTVVTIILPKYHLELNLKRDDALDEL